MTHHRSTSWLGCGPQRLIMPLLLLLLFTLLAPATVQAQNDTFDAELIARCAELEACHACNAESGCHFCAFDNKCHAYLSPWGCAIGMSCEEAESCIREKPMWEGYGTLSPAQNALIVLLVFVMSGLFVMTVGVVVLACLRRRRTAYLRSAPRELELGSNIQGDHMEAPLINLAHQELPADVEAELEDSLSLLRSVEDGAEPVDTSKCSIWRILRWTFGVMGFVILGVILAAVMMFPVAPDYSMCTVSIDWTSIFQGMKNGETRLDVDVHVSVYNPNRFGITIHSGDGILSYQDQDIGRGALNNSMELPAGTIVDQVFLVRFIPGLRIAAELLRKHLLGTLTLDLRMDLDTSISVADQRVYRLNTTFTLPDMDVGGPSSREWCLCRSKEDLPPDASVATGALRSPLAVPPTRSS